MIAAAPILANLYFGAFFPVFDSLFSTQGIMVILLCAYGVAMWMFLTSAPKVHTIMVSDLDIAQSFYEGILQLPAADVPMHYYYNYEQTLGGAGGIDPMYMGAASPSKRAAVPRKKNKPFTPCHSSKHYHQLIQLNRQSTQKEKVHLEPSEVQPL